MAEHRLTLTPTTTHAHTTHTHACMCAFTHTHLHAHARPNHAVAVVHAHVLGEGQGAGCLAGAAPTHPREVLWGASCRSVSATQAAHDEGCAGARGRNRMPRNGMCPP